MTTKTALPDQPDGIEDDSRDLPALDRAAERVGAYICANGDGMYHEIDGHPLYARDLEALRRAAEEAIGLRTARDVLAAEVRKVRKQLTAANHRADGLQNDLNSATKANTAWANETGLARALRATYTGAELLDLHALAVDQIDGEDTPREDPIGRLADALFCAMAMEQPAEVAR